MQQLSPTFTGIEHLWVNCDPFKFIYGYSLFSLILWLLVYCLSVTGGNTGM